MDTSPPPPPTTVSLRPPHHLTTATHTVPLPTPTQMAGTWWVTHSSLPLWRSKRNVRISYTVLPSKSSPTFDKPSPPARIDDLVEYQTLTSTATKTVHGTDTSHAKVPCVFNWRGAGLLAVASSQWEVLGWGRSQQDPGEEWMVTYFAKTVFTPAGLDGYSRRKGGVSQETWKAIMDQLGHVNGLGRAEGCLLYTSPSPRD